jgi:hypothetical protein
MTLRFKRSLVARFTLLSVLALTSFTFVGSANAVTPKTPTGNQAKKTVAKTKASKASGFNFLPFMRVATLGFDERVKYVHTLRALIIEAETAQTVFHNSIYASIDSKDLEKQNELFALILGQSVYAADPNDCDDGGRGRCATDVCISGYGISKYPNQTSGRRQPFLCEQTPCTGANGPGVRCNYYLSGIPASDPEGCIPKAIEYKSTVACEEVRKTLAARPQDVDAVAQSQKRFDFSNRPADQKPVLTKDMMTDDTAKKIISDLMNTAYRDDSFAELIKVIALYKKNGIALPVSGLEGFTDHFTKDFDSAQSGLQQIFADYINHCEHALNSKEVKMLRDPSWAQTVTQLGHTAQEMENKRIDALAKLDSGVTPTIENVLEVPECVTLKIRKNALQAQLNNAASTVPIATGPIPAPQAPAPPKPTAPVDDTVQTPTECRGNVGRSEDHLPQSAARCMVCLAERAMSRAGDDHNYPKDQEAYAYHKNYTVSTKWLSLMSTMVVACGDAVAGETAVQPDIMACYMEAFGHCSSEDYAWDPTGANARAEGYEGNPNDISQCDNWLVDQWADKNYQRNLADGKAKKSSKPDDNFWNGNYEDEASDPTLKMLNEQKRAQYQAEYEAHGCGRIKPRDGKKFSAGNKTAPDLNNDFVRVYGMTYETASDIFCDPNKFTKKKHSWLGKSVYTYDDKRPPMSGCSPQWIAQARERMKQHFEKTGGRDNPSANGLYRCLKNSYANANELYSAGQNYCISTNKVSTPDESTFRTMADQASQKIPSIIFDTASCYISKNHDARPGTNYAAVSYVDPSYMSTDTNPNGMSSQETGSLTRYTRVFYPTSNGDRGDEVAFPNYSVCQQSNSQCRKVTPLQSDRYQYFSYSHEDSNACNVPKDSKVGPNNGMAK